jgi:hypothetical protein
MTLWETIFTEITKQSIRSASIVFGLPAFWVDPYAVTSTMEQIPQCDFKGTKVGFYLLVASCAR